MSESIQRFEPYREHSSWDLEDLYTNTRHDNTYVFPELGIPLHLGKGEDQRNINLSILNIAEQARTQGLSNTELIRILQEVGLEDNFFHTWLSIHNFLDSSLTLVEAQLALARIKYNVGVFNKNTFLDNYVRYLPTQQDLVKSSRLWEEHGPKQLEDLNNYTYLLSANLVGATILYSLDSQGQKTYYMRRRYGGSKVATKGWTFPGGTADSLAEPTALEELIEEVDHPSILQHVCRARPLGIVDQILPYIVKNGDSIKMGGEGTSTLIRYLAMCWALEIPAPVTYELTSGDNQENWLAVPEEYLYAYVINSQITPIAQGMLLLDNQDYISYFPNYSTDS
jgi:hypothetical protein